MKSDRLGVLWRGSSLEVFSKELKTLLKSVSRYEPSGGSVTSHLVTAVVEDVASSGSGASTGPLLGLLVTGAELKGWGIQFR